MPPINDAYTEHQLKRWMRPDAHRFIRPDWRRFVKPGSDLWSVYECYERKYSPDQPRDDHGRWTSEGGDGVDGSPPSDTGSEPTAGSGRSDARVLSDATPYNYYKPGAQLAQNDGTSGYPVDLRQEDQLGGHTIGEHVAKSDNYLLARVRREALEAERSGWAEGLRVGSFPSLESANKLVNSTLVDNKAAIDRVVNGTTPYEIAKKEFGSVTGYEAYAATDKSQPYIRDTTGVAVFIVPDGNSAKGYRVHTAFPLNFDR
jgi:hypothetical protein